MASKKQAIIEVSSCVACGACLKQCPKSAIDIYKGVYAQTNSSICVGCGLCANICPTGSIRVVLREV